MNREELDSLIAAEGLWHRDAMRTAAEIVAFRAGHAAGYGDAYLAGYRNGYQDGISDTGLSAYRQKLKERKK